jgi:hypothetical protein
MDWVYVVQQMNKSQVVASFSNRVFLHVYCTWSRVILPIIIHIDSTFQISVPRYIK